MPAPQLGHDPQPAVPFGHAAHQLLAPFTAQPGADLQYDLPVPSCHQLVGQLLHAAFPVASWNLPVPQFGHEPMPALPLGHALQLALLPATTQPAPDLHAVWPLLPCHWLLGHALHAACPPEFWNLPAPHGPHAPVPAVPAEHAAQLCLSADTVHPTPCLQDGRPVAYWYQAAGQPLHDVIPATF